MKKAFELYGRVEAVLVTAPIGPITSETYGIGSLQTMSVPKIQAVRGYGIRGDRHVGARLADVREKELRSFGLPKGIEIANHREFSAVSIEELADIAQAMQLPQSIPHGCLGENLVLSGVPQLTALPTGTMLFFRKSEREIRTAVLVVWAENVPCQGPGEAIQASFPDIPRLARAFPVAAIGRRGIVGSVYVSGHIHTGDTVVAKIPRQQIYDPA
ncbi:MOSC domain-containing protein [Candidatus Kaiserbacteria bacterium]|nr:MOSC domain-containing protein [Candidatus Kaiserbacteria bacterium]